MGIGRHLTGAAALLLAATGAPLAGESTESNDALLSACARAAAAAGHDHFVAGDSANVEGSLRMVGEVGPAGARTPCTCVTDRDMNVVGFAVGEAAMAATIPDVARAGCAELADEHWHLDSGTSMPGEAHALADGRYELTMSGPGHRGVCKVSTDGRAALIEDG